jgi:hypothetical protein
MNANRTRKTAAFGLYATTDKVVPLFSLEVTAGWHNEVNFYQIPEALVEVQALVAFYGARMAESTGRRMADHRRLLVTFDGEKFVCSMVRWNFYYDGRKVQEEWLEGTQIAASKNIVTALRDAKEAMIEAHVGLFGSCDLEVFPSR